MTHEEFDRLVQNLEAGIGRDAKALHRRVRWLAIVGYAGLLAPLAGVLIISLAFLVPVLFWPQDALPLVFIGALILAIGGWSAGRVLWIRLSPPQGHPLTRAQTPALFALLDELRGRHRSVRIHRVLVVGECNAAVSYRPRLGVFGWHTNYLMLGLPLMEGLSRDEVAAVLAHECAHLSRRHHRSGQWIYRLRRSWELVFEQFSRPRTAGEVSLRPVMRKFVDWFWPRFNAHAFVLSRIHEYQADAAAAEFAGAAAATSALVRIAWYGRVLEDRFWPDLWQLTRTAAEPPEGVYLRLSGSLKQIRCPGEAKWLEQAWRTTTTNADTHPCLTDRMQAISRLAAGGPVAPSAPAPPARSAAEELFGDALAAIRTEVERTWRKHSEANWRQQHAKAGILHEQLDKLDRTLDAKRENVDTLCDKARMMVQLHREEEAKVLLRQVLEADPRHVTANFNLGRMLLESGDAAGEACLAQAVAGNEELLPQAANLLHTHFQRTGRADRIRDLHVQMDRYEKSVKASGQERSHITAADTFLPHDLTGAELESLHTALVAETEVIGAHLARKELRHFVREKLYVLCIRIRPHWHRLPDGDRDRAVVNRLIKSVVLPGRVFICTATGPFRAVARKVGRLPGTRVIPGNQG